MPSTPQPYLFGSSTDWSAPPGYEPRAYQSGWVDLVVADWAAGFRRNFGVASVGVGKTTGYMAELLRRSVGGVAADPYTVGLKRAGLVIAHTCDLVEQTANQLAKCLPRAAIEREQGGNRAVGLADIIVASRQSLSIKRRLQRIGRDRVKIVIWDECHRNRRGQTEYDTIHDFFHSPASFPPPLWHGDTATPDVADIDGLKGAYDRLVFQYDTLSAVQDGWLVKPYQVYEQYAGGDVEDTGSGSDGYITATEVVDHERAAPAVAAIVAAAIKWSNAYGRQRSTLVFCRSVDRAELVCQYLNNHDRDSGGRTGRAAVVSDRVTQDERRMLYRQYDAGELRYLVNFNILLEGYDSALATVVVNDRPFDNNRAGYGQMVGRVLRPAMNCRSSLAFAPDATARRAIIAKSEKPGALICDVVGTSHKLIIGVADVLSSATPREGSARQKAEPLLRDRSIPVDVMAEAAMVAERTKAKEIREAERAARIARASGVLVKAELVTTRANPFDLMDIPVSREPGWMRGRRATLAQVSALVRSGAATKDEADGMTYYKAKLILGTMRRRRESGLCTYRQLSLLRRCGYSGEYTFDEAGKLINRLAANGWQTPGEMP